MTTESKVIHIIAQHLSVKPEEIKREATLESLNLDSLDRVEIVMKIEEEFGIEIDDERADEICTVNQFIKYVDSLLKA